eukprot:7390966-Prymnesium_polylepis.1
MRDAAVAYDHDAAVIGYRASSTPDGRVCDQTVVGQRDRAAVQMNRPAFMHWCRRVHYGTSVGDCQGAAD